MRSIYRHRILAGLILSFLLILPAYYGFQGQSYGLVSTRVTDVLAAPEPQISGPFVSQPVIPYEYTGDLRDLPAPDTDELLAVPLPLKYAPGTEPKGASATIAGWHDPIAQTADGAGEMPSPILNFPGMNLDQDGGGWPPDTNGDVGPNHYIQTVNMAIAIYNKTGGPAVAKFTFNAFFNGTGTPCDNQNNGDPVVVYDRLADRWLITDFSVQGPYYECMAISKTGNPVSGGWWMYGVQISPTSMNDYPKFGVWPDAYYMSANMFQGGAIWDGVQVWAFNRQDMLAGQALRTVHFSLGPTTGYGSLLPSHMLSAPPAGAPNYFASVAPPNQFQIWKFHVDWTTPNNSTFTGPTVLAIADFAIAASVPQLDSPRLLDSLSYRPMMQLQYRDIEGVESLWLNHTVASQGVGAVRWYEVRDPGGTPAVFQQGTYQPDQNHRWMGALAVDRDGNMAVGYSVSSASMYPAIRYAGRLAGEIPGILTQGEASLVEGTGSQTTYSRWGDYSGMAVDPIDDCTFWYTTEYFLDTGLNWQTRIGTFKFPSCGQSKSFIEGMVRNAVTDQPVPDAPVRAVSSSQTLSVQTDQSGHYQFILLAGTYDLTAGPLLPGYPDPETVDGIIATTGSTTHQDILLAPVPYLVENGISLDDSGPLGDGDGYPEPGEQGMLLYEGLLNTGAITATHITAHLSSQTTGLTIDHPNAVYTDISPATTITNTTPFMFSLSRSVDCGQTVNFQKEVSTSEINQTLDFSLYASAPLPRADVFNNDVEAGAAGWTTGGTLNFWGITTNASHSPNHSWADSPSGTYFNNIDSFLRSPSYDLTGKRRLQVSGWFKYDLEAGYDYVYLEYSLDGGATWNPMPLAVFNGYHPVWEQVTLDAPMLDNQPDVALRFHFTSDPGVVGDGIYIDDIALSYEPFGCDYTPKEVPGKPRLLFPSNNGYDYNPVLFIWEDGYNGYSPTGYALSVDTSVYTYTASVTTTSITLPLGVHSWSVRAFNDDGSSLESEVWSFEVLPASPGLPGAPSMLSPADGFTVYSPFVLFHWRVNPSGGTPDGYILTLDGTDIYTSTTRLDWVILALPPGTHTWSVRAYNGTGQSSASPVWTVEVPYLGYFPVLGKD